MDQDEDTFAGKVLVDDDEALPEKTVDIEACGQLGIKNRTIMDLSFHHAAPVAALAQCDMVQLYQGNGISILYSCLFNLFSRLILIQ